MPRKRRGGRRVLLLAFVLFVVASLWFLNGALTLAPAPQIKLETDRPAIGAATHVSAQFSEPDRGLGTIKLELVQGDRTVALGEKSFARASTTAWSRGTVQAEAKLDATVGRGNPAWLKEGDALLRASADRLGGIFRRATPVIVEQLVKVRLRPPRLELLSQQHYVRQGGSGVVRLRVDEAAARSGVRVGNREFSSYPLPGGSAGEKFVLFGVPWNMGDGTQLKLFAEDEAGNRVELPFVTIFKPAPPRRDTIPVTDTFLEQVVPAITSQTPGFDASGSLLDQYVKINSQMRKENLAAVATLAKQSETGWLWSGPFLQMANSARRAGYAEVRSYEMNGRRVDQQTHLGLDLASLAHAPVPAPNSGRVVLAEFFGIYGNTVIIDHGYGLFSLGGHLSAIQVKVGDRVTKGQTIGLSGSTGLAGGDHLHLEMFVQGVSVDPVEWLDEHWIHDNLATKLTIPGF